MRQDLYIILVFFIFFSASHAKYIVKGDSVTFVYADSSAREVYVAGDFNNWDPRDIRLERSDGIFTITIFVSPGRHEYKFIVDGIWKEDPDNPETVPDPYGGKNSVLWVGRRSKDIELQSVKIGGKALFTYYNPSAREVYLAGEFNNWNPRQLLMENHDGTWEIRLDLPPGEYEYKFVVDGVWTADPLNPVTRGPMGNSVIKINPDGTATYPRGARLLANSIASSRILFGGLFTSHLVTYHDRDLPGDYNGDGRLKLYKPAILAAVDLRVHISEGVSLTTSFDVNAFDAEKIYEAHFRIDSIGASFESDNFNLRLFYNMDVFSTDDPLRAVGGMKYPEPTFEPCRSLGLGYAGLYLRKQWAEGILRGTAFDILFANLFKDWSFSPDSFDFINMLRRRAVGFWRSDIISTSEPRDFSDYGTDMLIARITRSLQFGKLGLTVRFDKNGWWLPLSEITYENIDSIYEAYELHSDWLELGSYELGTGVDLLISPLKGWDFSGEYMLWSYRSSIDAGNRENSDHTGDSTINITLGAQTGYLASGCVNVNIYEPITIGLTYLLERYDSMAREDVYIYPMSNDGSTGRPTLAYLHMPNYNRSRIEGSLRVTTAAFSSAVHIGWDKSTEWNTFFADLNGNCSPFRRIRIKSKGFYARGNANAYDFCDAGGVVNVQFEILRDWGLEFDLFGRWLRVRSDTSESVTGLVLAPYCAFLYEPVPHTRLEISYGVRPYNVIGQYVGRTEWVYNTMRQNSLSFITALQRLEAYRCVNLYASVRF